MIKTQHRFSHGFYGVLVLAAISMFAFSGRAIAAEPTPGTACATLGEVVYTGGPGEAGYFLSCNGSQYVSILGYANDGKTLIQLAQDTTTCNAAIIGRLREYNGIMEMCQGTCWLPWGLTACDMAPDAFSFIDQTDVAVNTLIESNVVQITGVAGNVPVSLTGSSGSPQFRICENVSCSTVLVNWTSGPDSIFNNQYVQLRVTSAPANDTLYNVGISVGSGSDTWSVTTINDRNPNSFLNQFNDLTGRAISQSYDSNIVQITGLTGTTTPVSISGNGGQFRICNDAACSGGGDTAFGTSGTIQNNYYIQLRQTSSGSYGTTVSTTLTVGIAPNNTDTWSLTTAILTTFSINGPFTYTGGTITPTITPSPGGATFTPGGTLSATNAGTYTATATATGDYTGTNNSLSWTIDKANQTAVAGLSNQTTSVGNGLTFTPTGGSGTGAFTWGGTCGVTGTGASKSFTFMTAGTCTVTVYKAADANYNQSNTVSVTITVNQGAQAAVSISPGPTHTTTHGSTGVSFTPSGGSGTGGWVWGGTCPSPGASMSFSGVGTCTVTVYKAADSNYLVSNTYTTTVTINAASTTFSITPTSFTYNGGAQGPGITPTPGGASWAITAGGNSQTNAGSYSVTATANGNYTGTSGAVGWTIAKRNQSTGLSPTSQTINPGQSINFTGGGTCHTGNYVWGSSASGSGSTKNVTFNSVGTFYVTVYCVGDGNHNDSSVQTATITVSNPCDDLPDWYGFSDEMNANPNQGYYSNVVQITGIACATPISMNGAGINSQYRICNDPGCGSVAQGWGSGASNIYNGQYVQLYSQADGGFGVLHTPRIIVGSFWDFGAPGQTWNIQTRAANGCNSPCGWIGHGGSCVAYQSDSVAFPPCVDETRYCNDGSLSGSYAHGGCSVQAPPVDCNICGGTVPHGGWADTCGYYGSWGPIVWGDTCDNGNMVSGNWYMGNCCNWW